MNNMFENMNKPSLKPKESNPNIETRDNNSKIKNLLEKEENILIRFRGKAGKVSRMMLMVSTLSLGVGATGAGIYEIAHFANQSAQEMNEVHKGTGIILKKEYHKAVNEGFDKPYYSLQINMGSKVLDAEVSESIFQNAVDGKQVSFQYQDRQSLIIPKLGIKAGPEIIINSLEQQAK